MGHLLDPSDLWLDPDVSKGTRSWLWIPWKFKHKIVYKKWIIGLTRTMWGLHQVCDISSQSYTHTHTHTHLKMHKLNCEPPTFVDPARYGRMITKFIRFLHSSWLRLLATRQMKQMSSFNSFFAAQCVHKSWSGCLNVAAQLAADDESHFRSVDTAYLHGSKPGSRPKCQTTLGQLTADAGCQHAKSLQKASGPNLWKQMWDIAIFLKHLGYVWGPLILQ